MAHFCIKILLILVLTGCSIQKDKPLVIAVSKASPNYINWLKKGD